MKYSGIHRDTTAFRESLKKLGLTVSSDQENQFIRYYEMLLEWNKKINLTAITDFDQVMMKHFTDSAAFSLAFSESDNISGESASGPVSLIDVGTGAGFPGIPIKILYPEIQVVLLDSLGKRVQFLKEVIRELGLKDIKAFHGRAEDFGRTSDFREHFDFAVSRAVANLSVLSEYCIPFIRAGGCFVAYKSGNLSEETGQCQNALQLLNSHIERNIAFRLEYGSESADRSLIIIRKDRNIPSKYPRKAGIPGKRPL